MAGSDGGALFDVDMADADVDDDVDIVSAAGIVGGGGVNPPAAASGAVEGAPFYPLLGASDF